MSGSVAALPSYWRQVYDKWTRRWIGMASLVGSWSKDPSTQVGCVIVDIRNRVVSTGYNGFAISVEDDYKIDRDMKLALTIHAEENALLNAGRSVAGCSAFVTHPPCTGCMAKLINSRIETVVTAKPSEYYMSRWGNSVDVATAMAVNAGVRLLYLNTDS